jgi:transcriptional regulator with XRE-family HTH domain
MEPASVAPMRPAADEPRINGPALRAIREALDISMIDLANQVGIHRTYLGKIERGERQCRTATIRRLAAALYVPPDAICRLSQSSDAA